MINKFEFVGLFTPFRHSLRSCHLNSRLPARSVLLLRRGVHRTPAPSRGKAKLGSTLEGELSFSQKMTEGGIIATQFLHFAFCILRFAFCSTNSNSPNKNISVKKGQSLFYRYCNKKGTPDRKFLNFFMFFQLFRNHK